MREIKFRAWDKKGKTMCKVALRDILEAKARLIMNCDDDVTAIMEFTGLKDKNGREIYEGDIVKDDNGRIIEVFWNELTNGWWFSEANTHVKRINLIGIEVIGNIYENPELFENATSD